MEVSNLEELEKERDKIHGSQIFHNCYIHLDQMDLDGPDIHRRAPKGDMVPVVLDVDSIKGAWPTIVAPDGHAPSFRTYASRDEQCQMERNDFIAAAEHARREGKIHVCVRESDEGVWRVLCFCKI